MNERRSSSRQKSFLQGRIYFNNRRSSVDCLVRDYSEHRRALKFSESITVPEAMELYIPNKEEIHRARVEWRSGNEMGVSFGEEVRAPSIAPDAAQGDLPARVQRLEGGSRRAQAHRQRAARRDPQAARRSGVARARQRREPENRTWRCLPERLSSGATALRFGLPACKIQTMALDVYRKKRKFDVTPEPRGRKARDKGNRYVIQKHAATRLHYDLRLELDGVMKSWAVTRGPSLVPGEKRLAVETEDHPVEYNAFEGTIPKGEYGGGTVMIWDRGTWTPEEDPHRGLKKGHLDFSLDGEKLARPLASRAHARPAGREAQQLAPDQGERRARAHGEGCRHPGGDAGLRRLRPLDRGDRGREGKEARLAFEQERRGQCEGRRDARRRHGRPSKASREKRSNAQAQARSASRDAALPDFVPPSLATLRDAAPSGARLGARDQVRRLPHAGAARSRQGQAADPQGARLGRKISERRGRRRAACGRHCADRRRDRGREQPRACRISRCCRRRSATASATALSIMCSICFISTARTCPASR